MEVILLGVSSFSPSQLILTHTHVVDFWAWKKEYEIEIEWFNSSMYIRSLRLGYTR